MAGPNMEAVRGALKRIRMQHSNGPSVEIEIGEKDEPDAESATEEERNAADPEIYGRATDDDPELPGALASVIKRRRSNSR